MTRSSSLCSEADPRNTRRAQVRTLPNGTHESVPAWELYNHHYGNTIIGKGAKLVKTGIPTDHAMAERAEVRRRFRLVAIRVQF